MEPFHIDYDTIITVPLIGAAGLLKPIVYIDGKYYCVLLGTDPDSGVYGRGRTLNIAFENWHYSLKKHLATSDDEDYIVAHIKTILHKPQEPADLKAFYEQFKLGEG